MNTFVPHGRDFPRSAQDLDKKRLGKQLVECEQIYNALTTGGPAHILHHPATQMWDGHLWTLRKYAEACLKEWVWRYGKSHVSGERVVAGNGNLPLFLTDMAPPPASVG